MTDLSRKRGDTYSDQFEIVSESTNLPISIVGYSFIMTVDPIRFPPDGSTIAFQIIGSITDAENGIVEFAPTLSQADKLGLFYYDIQMTDPSGKKRTVDSGEYKFSQDITKD